MNKCFTIKLLSVFLLVLIAQISNSQIVTDKTRYDFGEIEKEDKKYIDFKFTNASTENITIVKFETPYGVSLRFSDKNIAPDETVLVRIKYTPKRKGEFKADVPIYVSSNTSPIVLTILGKAVSVNMDETLDVPEFEEVQEKKADETFDLDIKVVRKEDGSPVENAHLDVIWNGVLYKSLQTDGNGVIKSDYTPDKYYVVAKAKDLGGFESELSIHKNIKEFVIELGPEGTLSAFIQDSADVYETEVVEIPEEEVAIAVIPEPEPEPEVPIEEPEEERVQENEEFSDLEYLPNNIVFLIDVSVSMKQKGKMNLLKASMMELTGLLRSIDKVAIVTYSSNANLVLKSTSASDKSKIKNVIQNLQPKGSTSGQKGLKKAYQVLKDNAIENGNNQIFISTDGAFNLERQDKGMLETVRKNTKKGYKISVLGIKNDKWTVKNMKLIAKEGGGNYIHITGYENARKSLVEEIKVQSRNLK